MKRKILLISLIVFLVPTPAQALTRAQAHKITVRELQNLLVSFPGFVVSYEVDHCKLQSKHRGSCPFSMIYQEGYEQFACEGKSQVVETRDHKLDMSLGECHESRE